MEDKIFNGPNKIAHLQMIQGVISRMGGNSFYLRGWSITLIVGLFAIYTSELLEKMGKDMSYLFIIIFFLFWIFDSYFLSLERKFRGLYDKVREISEEDIDFSMDISEFRIHADKTFFAAMFSPTLFGFYGVLGVTMLLIILNFL
jgi:hypothetical protein